MADGSATPESHGMRTDNVPQAGLYGQAQDSAKSARGRMLCLIKFILS